MLCYSKTHGDNRILVAINLDPTQEQAGWIDLDLKKLALPYHQDFEIEDLLTGTHYQWHDRSNYVALRPDVQPAHIFRIVTPTPFPGTNPHRKTNPATTPRNSGPPDNIRTIESRHPGCGEKVVILHAVKDPRICLCRCVNFPGIAFAVTLSLIG
ncbi:MAG: hypothetical protein WDN23_19615 [Edaphobacter sp.]